jgi:uncharacterized protein YndB with AHSA1/START domain
MPAKPKAKGARRPASARKPGLPDITFTRVLDAPRTTVWEAWTKGEHLKAWFAPKMFTTPEASIEPRRGGAMRIVMRSPDGQDFPSTGTVKLARAPEKLVFSSTLTGSDGKPMLVDETTVTLADLGGRTKVTVRARILKATAEAKPALQGMKQGWNETLDRMVEHAVSIKPKRSVTHHTFVIERSLGASREQAFRAFADRKAKGRWFIGPDAWKKSNHKLDFRVGGTESVSGGPPGGPMHHFNATYQDIVPNERIIYAYEMHLDDARISVSLATFEFVTAGSGTNLKLTEQGAYLDSFDNPGQREQGTRDLLDKLEAELNRQ